MDIKAFLKDYPFLSAEILRLQKELNTALKARKDTYITVKAAPLAMHRGSSGISDSVSDAVQIIVDRLENDIAFYVRQINIILDQKAMFEKIWFGQELLSKAERTILEMRHFDHYPWPTIAKTVRYSERQCQRLNEMAIEKMQTEADRLTLTA